MFKNFPGYHMVESYHEWKKQHRTKDKTVSRVIRLAIAIILALAVWCLPCENWIDGMTIIQKRTMAIFLFAILMWLFEAVPAWTTSVMVVVLLLFATSDSSLVFFENGAHRLRDVKLGALFRLFVVANVISQSVVQLTIAHIGVERQRLRFLLCKKRRCT